LTLSFPDHFVIKPSITFFDHPDYKLNGLRERGEEVDPEFEYNSGTNPHFLSVSQIQQLLATTP
jgi:UDP-N-acetylglucosamine 4,6-dehydratase/5-epimerase